jgi:nitrous oxide reductase accessory protein NosL
VIFCNVKNKVNFWQLKEPIRDISSLFCEQMTKLVKRKNTSSHYKANLAEQNSSHIKNKTDPPFASGS